MHTLHCKSRPTVLFLHCVDTLPSTPAWKGRPASLSGGGHYSERLETTPCHVMDLTATEEGLSLLVEPAGSPLTLPDRAATLPARCRAWRRIEDHIGTKTAVQIRSHAQKFFSKLEKEQAAGAKGAAHLFSTVLAQMRCMCSISLPVCCLWTASEHSFSSASLALWRPAA